MPITSSSLDPSLPWWRVAVVSALAAGLSACAVYDDGRPGGRETAWNHPNYPYQPAPYEAGVYVEPPLYEPAPVAVPAGPPPMLAEVMPPPPFRDAVWLGGYWVWQGRWVWATGRWAPRPRPDYAWVQPFYERRGPEVIFIAGHWRAPGPGFGPPPRGGPPQFQGPGPGFPPGVGPGPGQAGPRGGFPPQAPPPPTPPQGGHPVIIAPAPAGVASPPPERGARPPSGPSWRGWADRAVPPALQPEAPREQRGAPRSGGGQAAPIRGERGGQPGQPGEFPRRSAQPTPVPAAPAAQATPASPGAVPGGAPAPRREEGPRRPFGPRGGDRDKKEQKAE